MTIGQADAVASPPPATGTSTHRRAVWARRSRLATARRAPFWVLLAAGVVAACSATTLHLALTDRWRDADGLLPEGLVRLTVLAVFALIVALLTTVVGAIWAAGALADAPVDDVLEYGGGRRVELTWADRYATRGRMTLEELPDARVTATRGPAGGRILPATVAVAGGPGVRVVARHEASGTTAYEVTSGGATIRLSAEERRDGSVDRTLDDGRGTMLRWRQRPGDLVPRVTVHDDHGSAWWVSRTSRTSVRAELPDELDPAAARAMVLIVEDQLTNATHRSGVLHAADGDAGRVVTGGD